MPCRLGVNRIMCINTSNSTDRGRSLASTSPTDLCFPDWIEDHALSLKATGCHVGAHINHLYAFLCTCFFVNSVSLFLCIVEYQHGPAMDAFIC